jgi:glycosyl transferase family 25
MGAVGIDYLKLYSRFANRPQYVGRVGHRSLIRFAKESYGNQAYMVSTAGARKLTRAISRIDRPVDDEMERYWITGLPVYAIFPYPVLELNVSSTVPKGSTPNDVSFAQMALRTIYQVDEKVRR